jgi:hypothetical protein
MNYLFIIVPAILIGIVLLYIALDGALDAKIREEQEDPFDMQEEPKFEPRKVTDLSKEKFPVEEKDAIPPKKKKYYKKRPTKKSE